MPELIEQMYCSQQIVIPPKYPYILKRYCKAAIKTQPYDLLRWSFEYFRALAEHRPPPVKLRLEYPVYSTEGGLTRGCLKVLAHQLSGMVEIPKHILLQAWQGFCLHPMELNRILCLCEVYLRKDSVPFLHFIAVAGGMLTKCLTHTMILLCESLTKEPDGGSAAIPVKDFLSMYRYLAVMDASKDVRYHNGYREGEFPEAEVENEVSYETAEQAKPEVESDDEDDYWGENDLQRLALIDDHVARTARLSVRLNLPTIGKIERSPSIERIREIERENYMRQRKGKVTPSEEVNKKLKELSSAKLSNDMAVSKEDGAEPKEKDHSVTHVKDAVCIFVFDEDGNKVQYKIYGEPGSHKDSQDIAETSTDTDTVGTEILSEEQPKEEASETVHVENQHEKVAILIEKVLQNRKARLDDIEQVFDDIAKIVDKFKTANYDLGMVAGRQMSITSGEFIVHQVEKDIMEYIDEQIAILPDPDLKKKKAKPEEVAMVRDILEQFLDDNMEFIVPEVEEIEEEESPIPEITTVYAVPGIGGPVDMDIIGDFKEYCLEVAKVQGDMIMPRNIRHFLCPPLEKYIEPKYEQVKIKEEVATGGAITD